MGSLHAVIMAGGSGTRFWPASRRTRPKQVLPLADGVPLIAATRARLNGLCDDKHTWIVTNADQLEAIRTALPDFDPDHIIIEPSARDTAPCVALATATVAASDPDATMVVMPADHALGPIEAFQAMVHRGAQLAADDRTLVTFGIEPTRPATGFGYIERGEAIDDRQPAAFRAVRFREKPDAATAEQFVAGGMLWNSGIFVWTTRGLMAAMQVTSTPLHDSTAEMIRLRGLGHAIDEAFEAAPQTSIDFAVMEHAPAVAVIRAAIDWNDVGGFTALADFAPEFGAGNRGLLLDGASQLALDSKNNVIYAEGKRTVALFGVQDLVVVAVGDAVMVCPRDRADDLKALIEHARSAGRDDVL